MNTASRMESTGVPGKVLAGKKEWFIPRENKIVAMGKGELEIFWLGSTDMAGGSSTVSSNSDCGLTHSKESDDTEAMALFNNGVDSKTSNLTSGKVAVG